MNTEQQADLLSVLAVVQQDLANIVMQVGRGSLPMHAIGELDLSSYTIAAYAAVYDLMVADRRVPKAGL